jgi:glycosyltransferase involved in cell wall biosynthesis
MVVESKRSAAHTKGMPDAIDPGSARSEPKRVLLVAFDFPPRRTSGVYRPTALTKYLPSNGWEPTVLTIRSPSGVVSDPALLKRVPDTVQVHRTRHIPLNGWEHKLLKAARSAGTLRPSSADGGEVATPQARRRYGLGVVDPVLRGLARLVRASLYFPDETVGWIPFGLAAALRLHRKRPFDLVYTTHPPRAAHPIGMLMQRMCDVPWVMEFRDPWILPEHETTTLGRASAERRNAWLHRRMLKACSSVVTVTPRHAEELEQSFGVNREKISVIRNGFDEDDFRGIQADSGGLFDPRFVNLAQFGTVYPGFSGKFFHAAAELLAERPELKDQVRFHLVGYPDQTIESIARESPLKETVIFHGFLEHSKVLPLMLAADGLLLFYGDDYTSRSSVPGKLYEYLRIGRPILAVAFPGGVQDLIQEANAGTVLPPDDIPGIKAALARIIAENRERQSTSRVDSEVVSRFRYDRLAQQLATVFDKLVQA